MFITQEKGLQLRYGYKERSDGCMILCRKGRGMIVCGGGNGVKGSMAKSKGRK